MSDDRPSRYVEQGRVVWRASALGSCVKSLVALGMGMTPEPWPRWLLERFEQGRIGEPVVVEKLKSRWRLLNVTSGWWLQWHDGQVLVEVEVGSGIVVRGHADAVGVPYRSDVGGPHTPTDGDRRLLEIKCVTPGYAEEILRHLPDLYAWQISTYAQRLGLKAVLVLGIKGEDGKVERVVEQPVPTIGLAAIKLRVIEIERMVRACHLPRCDYRQWPCRFPELCDDPVPPATEDWELEEKLAESLVMIRGR